MTTVKIYGDLLINDEIPTHPDGAIAFMKSLPVRTIGDHQGVPMEMELTPLVGLNSKAGKLMRDIANDMFEKLVQIYESFDESERTLWDLISCVPSPPPTFPCTVDQHDSVPRVPCSPSAPKHRMQLEITMGTVHCWGVGWHC